MRLTAGERFVFGEKGKKICPDGYEMIFDKEECKEACTGLEVHLSNSNLFKDDKPCIKGGNEKCRQNNNFGSNAFVVCQKIGMKIYSSYQVAQQNPHPNQSNYSSEYLINLLYITSDIISYQYNS